MKDACERQNMAHLHGYWAPLRRFHFYAEIQPCDMRMEQGGWLVNRDDTYNWRIPGRSGSLRWDEYHGLRLSNADSKRVFLICSAHLGMGCASLLQEAFSKRASSSRLESALGDEQWIEERRWEEWSVVRVSFGAAFLHFLKKSHPNQPYVTSFRETSLEWRPDS